MQIRVKLAQTDMLWRSIGWNQMINNTIDIIILNKK